VEGEDLSLGPELGLTTGEEGIEEESEQGIRGANDIAGDHGDPIDQRPGPRPLGRSGILV
jgi:hypothetical protein